jgi:putative oxidoreductase
VRSLQPYALSLLRITTGFTFSLHGFQKLFGFFGGLGGHGATAHFFSLIWLAAVLETAGGVLIFLGLGTSPVAFILCGEMAAAYFMQHFPKGFWPITNGGELAMLYCFIFLFLFTAGAGPWSLDRIVRKKK